MLHFDICNWKSNPLSSTSCNANSNHGNNCLNFCLHKFNLHRILFFAKIFLSFRYFSIFFLFTSLITVCLFGLFLVGGSLWQALMSLYLILMSIWLKTSCTLLSRSSSLTSFGIPLTPCCSASHTGYYTLLLLTSIFFGFHVVFWLFF